MTEKKKISQRAGLYHFRTDSTRSIPPARRRRSSDEKQRPQRATYALRRVVTVPETDPSVAWRTFAQRRGQVQRSRGRSSQTVLVPRTLAQTGSRAAVGRIKAMPRPLPRYRSQVPTRSGQQRAQRSLLGKLLRALSVGVVGVALLAALSLGLTSSAFRIEQVNVVGTHNDALIQAIQRMGMQGQNIFLLNIASLKDRIATSPYVATVDLNKQLPNQLTVTVVERSPVLLWQTSQGTFSVDNQGVIITRVNAASNASRLATVIDVTPQSKKQAGQVLQPGGHLDQKTVTFALNIFKYLPQMVGISSFKLRYDGTMYASTSDQVVAQPDSKGSYIVESPDGWSAYLGGVYDDNPLDNRLIELREILKLAQKNQLNVATIDLRYGLHPVFTLH